MNATMIQSAPERITITGVRLGDPTPTPCLSWCTSTDAQDALDDPGVGNHYGLTISG